MDGKATTEHCGDEAGAHNASAAEAGYSVYDDVPHSVSPKEAEHSTQAAEEHSPAREEGEKAEQRHAPKPRIKNRLTEQAPAWTNESNVSS